MLTRTIENPAHGINILTRVREGRHLIRASMTRESWTGTNQPCTSEFSTIVAEPNRASTPRITVRQFNFQGPWPLPVNSSWLRRNLNNGRLSLLPWSIHRFAGVSFITAHPRDVRQVENRDNQTANDVQRERGGLSVAAMRLLWSACRIGGIVWKAQNGASKR